MHTCSTTSSCLYVSPVGRFEKKSEQIGSRLNHTSSMEGAFAYFRTQGLKLAGSSQENWELTALSVFVWSNMDDFKICVKTDYFVMIHINCDSLWVHIQAWQLTRLDVSSTCVHASRWLSACCPVWKLPEHRNNALLSPWNTPMMVAASSRKFQTAVLLGGETTICGKHWGISKNVQDSPRSLEHYCKVCMSMIFKWSTKTSLSKI